MEFAQLVIIGLGIGSIYTLVAYGINVIYAAARVLNFAQGELLMLGAYLSWTLSSVAHWQLPWAIIGAAGAVALLGAVEESIAVRPVRRFQGSTAWLLSTLGLSIILQNAARGIWGLDYRAVEPFLGSEFVNAFGLTVGSQDLVMLAGVVVFTVILDVVQNRTLAGKALRAIAWNPQVASLMGINVQTYITGAFAAGGALAAIAGALAGPVTHLHPYMGFGITLKAFVVVILGGLGDSRGALVGGLLLGVAEVVTAAYLGSWLREVVSIGLLIVVLLARPQGLFARPSGVRA